MTSFFCWIILVPGAFSAYEGGSHWFITAEEYFSEYRRFFVEKKCTIETLSLPIDGTIEERSLVLRDQVEKSAKKMRVTQKGARATLIAHSQGALDARFALNRLNTANYISELITVGAPHRGTPMANWAVSQYENKTILNWVLENLFSYHLSELRFIPELTAEFLDKHKKLFTVTSSIRIASAQAECKTHCYWPLNVLSFFSNTHFLGDGIIPTASQRFGDDLGTYDLDHRSEVATDKNKESERKRLLESIWSWLRKK